MNTYDLTFEMAYLEQLAIKRGAKLESIALNEMMRLDRDCDKSLDPVMLSKISHDNIVTDVNIRQHFLEYPAASHEIHFKRCVDSGVTYCTCTPEKTITGGVL